MLGYQSVDIAGGSGVFGGFEDLAELFLGYEGIFFGEGGEQGVAEDVLHYYYNQPMQ